MTNIHNGWSNLPPVERQEYARNHTYAKSPKLGKQGKTHAETVALRRAAGYGGKKSQPAELGKRHDAPNEVHHPTGRTQLDG